MAAILAGWALAQKPTILPGLTIQQAAAPHDTLVLLVVAVLGGGAILFPSLVLLFRLQLGDSSTPAPSTRPHLRPLPEDSPRPRLRDLWPGRRARA